MPQPISDLPGSMPTSATEFVGREVEIGKLIGLLARPACRLVTIVGMTGIAKTRLALEVIARSQMNFPGEACFISFVTFDPTNDIFSFLADALKLPFY